MEIRGKDGLNFCAAHDANVAKPLAVSAIAFFSTAALVGLIWVVIQRRQQQVPSAHRIAASLMIITSPLFIVITVYLFEIFEKVCGHSAASVSARHVTYLRMGDHLIRTKGQGQ